jgi:D-alanyl-lipoteichoic acid acyltransferase DltB (MBOAT superfamily)
LYIPLGGNKKGSIVSYILFVLLVAILTMLLGLSVYWLQIVVSLVILMLLYQIFPSVRKHINTNINLMLTMLLGGLWHGSTLNFIVWGGLNGLALVFYKHWRKISPWEKLNQWYIRTFKILFTFAFISFTRIWFRAADEQTATSVREMIFYKLDFSYAGDVLLGFWKVFLVFALGMTIHWLPKELKNKVKYSFIKSPVYTKVIVVLITVLIIWQTVSADFIPFIYFQF